MTRTGRSLDDRIRRSMLRPFFVCLLPVLLITGCRGRSDLVEAELRTREAELRQTRTDLQRAEGLNYTLQHELQFRPGVATPAPPFCDSLSGTGAALTGMIKEVTLGRGTGGIDEDQWPGHEALMIVLVPKDVDGSAIKVPGNLVVLASEITPEGVKLPISNWEVPSLQLQKMWQSGLFSTGYHVKLVWKKWPSTEKLRITCHFTTLPDNRLFEVDKDVTVKLVPGGPRAVPGMIVPGPGSPPVAPAWPGPSADGPVVPPGAWIQQSQKPAPADQSSAPTKSPQLLEPVVK